MILPGEATVYVGGGFVAPDATPPAWPPASRSSRVSASIPNSRSRIAGWCTRPARFREATRSSTYEFRIGLRNYRPGPVRVQLWDRLPKPQGEAVAVALVKASSELSTDGPLPAHRTDGQPAAVGRRSTSGYNR